MGECGDENIPSMELMEMIHMKGSARELAAVSLALEKEANDLFAEAGSKKTQAAFTARAARQLNAHAQEERRLHWSEDKGRYVYRDNEGSD